VDDLDSKYIRLYRSTDGGQTWQLVISFATWDDSRNPSIAYGEHSIGNKWVYVAYEGVRTADDNRRVMVFRIKPDGSSWSWVIIDGPFMMNGVGDQVYPQIITDLLDYGDDYYVHVTYAAFGINYYPVFYSRSTNGGVDWSAPSNVTGGSENTTWATRPEIAFGTPGLLITFVKPGWNGDSHTNQIWVTKSTTDGDSFTAPVQLTSTPWNVFHPSVAAAHGVNSAVIAYTVVWAFDMDVAYMASIDGGANWSGQVSLPWTFDHESSVDLTVSNSNGNFHAAYAHEATAGGSNNIWYTSASTATPTAWSSAQQIVEGDTASGRCCYPRPTITAIPDKPPGADAAIAWTDFRNLPYRVYFESPIFADGFESGNTSAWSSTVP
jgi:hypothetical protein